MFNVMVRHKGKVELRVSQLQGFAENLRAVADACDAGCDLATSKGIDSLNVTHFPTGEDGIESVSKFVGAVYTAATEAMLKQTFQAGTKKAAPKKAAKD